MFRNPRRWGRWQLECSCCEDRLGALTPTCRSPLGHDDTMVIIHIMAADTASSAKFDATNRLRIYLTDHAPVPVERLESRTCHQTRRVRPRGRDGDRCRAKTISRTNW